MLPWHELADNSTCVRLGLSDATMLAARDAIPLSSPYSSPLQFFLPIFSSKVDSPSQAFVWLHGLGGNANDYYCNGVATAATAESSLETLSVAPWFASEQVTLDDWLGSARADDWRRRNNWTTGGKSIYWGPHRGGWMRGADSSPEWERYTTSFDAFDATVQWLRLSHPTLKNTSAVGFSAGSQFLSRWAFFSQEMEIGSNITSVISDPGSYLYLERRRPASTCRPLEDTGANHTCDSFLVPDAAGCPDFDEYKYGLSNLGGSLYLEKFAANATLLEQVSMATHERGLPAQLSASARPRRHAPPPSHRIQAVAAYPYRDLRYLFGEHDVCNCNTPGYVNSQTQCYPSNPGINPHTGELGCSPNTEGGSLGGNGCCDTYPDGIGNQLDHNCQSMLQGSNRLQRGRNYLSYLQTLAPDAELMEGTYNAAGHEASRSPVIDAEGGRSSLLEPRFVGAFETCRSRGPRKPRKPNRPFASSISSTPAARHAAPADATVLQAAPAE